MDIDSWYEPPALPFYCCHTPTWAWHGDQMYCQSCDADIPTPSGVPQDAHVRVFRGQPLLPPPVTVEPPPAPPRHPESVPRVQPLTKLSAAVAAIPANRVSRVARLAERILATTGGVRWTPGVAREHVDAWLANLGYRVVEDSGRFKAVKLEPSDQ